MAATLLRSLSSLCARCSCAPLSTILFLLPSQLQLLHFSNAATAAGIPSKNPNNNNNDDNDKMMNLLASNATTPKRIFKAFNKNPASLNNTAALKMATRKLARQGATHEIELIIEKLLLKSSRSSSSNTKTKKIGRSKQIHRDEEQQQEQWHEQMQEQVVMQAVNMYAEAGMADHMVRTFEKHLRITAKVPSLPLFNALIRGLVAARNPKMALDFFHNLPNYGVRPNLVTYNIAVKALCDEMQHESSMELLLSMKRRSGIQASHVSYDTIVDSLYNQLRKGQISKTQMEELMEKLLKSCESEAVESGIRFRRLCKERKTAEARALMQQMVYKGFHLQLHEVTTLVIALCKQGLVEDAKNVFFGIIDSQAQVVAVAESSEVMSSESESYNVIARCFLRKGDAEAAMAVCRRMAQRQCAFEESTVRALLSSEATASQAQSLGLTANSNNPYHEQWSNAEPSVLLF